jgi:hypothetical protein
MPTLSLSNASNHEDELRQQLQNKSERQWLTTLLAICATLCAH